MIHLQKGMEISLCFLTSTDICGPGTTERAFSNDCQGYNTNNC